MNWLRIEGLAHYVASAQCRLLGMVEEDVIFPTNPYGLVRVESLFDPEEATLDPEVVKCTGVFQTSGALVFFRDGKLNGQMDGGTSPDWSSKT